MLQARRHDALDEWRWRGAYAVRELAFVEGDPRDEALSQHLLTVFSLQLLVLFWRECRSDDDHRLGLPDVAWLADVLVLVADIFVRRDALVEHGDSVLSDHRVGCGFRHGCEGKTTV